MGGRRGRWEEGGEDRREEGKMGGREGKEGKRGRARGQPDCIPLGTTQSHAQTVYH